MISHPDWTDEQLVESSYRLAEMMMKRSRKRQPAGRRRIIVYNNGNCK